MFKILYIVLILFSKTQSAQRYKKIFEFANFFFKNRKKGQLAAKKQKIVI